MIIVFLLISTSGFCDHAVPLATHLKKVKISYKSHDYNTTITEACNALYHERQKSTAYSYLARAYEEMGLVIPAIASYMKYTTCCKPDNIKKARRKIEYLKKKTDEKLLKAALANIPERVLTSEAHYKRSKVYRIKDFIYDPLGRKIEEKYCRPNGGNEYKLEYIYNSKGLLIEKNRYDDDGMLSVASTILYKDGKEARLESRNPSGDVVSKESYAYDLGGNLKSVMVYNKDEELVSKKSLFYNKDNLYEETLRDYKDSYGMGNYTARNIYKEGKLVGKEINYKAGQFEKVKYAYRGGKLKNEIYYSTEDVPVKSKKYVYNASGDLREIGEYKIFSKRRQTLTSKVSYQYSKKH